MSKPPVTHDGQTAGHFRRRRCMGLAIALCFAAAAHVGGAADSSGQSQTNLADLPIEKLLEIEVPIVEAASKREQKATEAPAAVSVVTSDDIRMFGYRTLADALQSVSGFHVSYDRNYAFLGVRGINLGDFNGRVLLLVNGHRVNNNLTDGALIDTAFLLDVDLIERVEIIRGAGSVLYGNNAFFGVINVVTRNGAQINGTELSGEYAEFDTYKGRVTAGKTFTNGVNFIVSASVYDSAGQDKLFFREFNTRGQNFGVARNRDDDEFHSVFAALSYRDFTLESAFNRREKRNPTAQFLTAFNDPRLRTVDERAYTALKYAHSFPEIVDVTTRLYYDRSEFRIGYPQRLTIGTNTISSFSRERDLGEWWGAELQFDKEVADRHKLTLGAEYRDDFRQQREFTGQRTVRSDRQSHGVYAQGDFEIIKEIHFNGGVRYDEYGDFDPSFNPRLALIANPAKGSTIKAIYGTAFRVPNFLELALSPADQLDPEEITSYELICEQDVNRHLRTSLAGFYNDIDGLIIFESGRFNNLDVTAKGVELAAEAFWTNIVRTRLSYTVQTTDSDASHFELPDSPEHLVKLNATVPLWRDKVFAGVEFQYTSQRASLHTTSSAGGNPITIQGDSAGGYGVVNLTLFSRELIRNLEASASIYNLFDQRFSDPATRFHQQDTLERDGRAFRVKFTYRF